MKTAIQELIEVIEERLKTLSIAQRTESVNGAIAAYQYCKYLLIESEDIERDRLWQSWINSEMRNKKLYPINEDLEMERFIEYYNQTYNQNK